MNNQPLSYRSWLQDYTNDTNQNQNNRYQAQALLNIVGDNGRLDDRFTQNQAYSAPGISRSGLRNPSNWSDGGGHKYNVQDMTNLNSDFYGAYTNYVKQFTPTGKDGGGSPDQIYTPTGGGGVSNTNQAQINRDLARFPGYYSNLDLARDNKLGWLNEDYTSGLNSIKDKYALIFSISFFTA